MQIETGFGIVPIMIFGGHPSESGSMAQLLIKTLQDFSLLVNINPAKPR